MQEHLGSFQHTVQLLCLELLIDDATGIKTTNETLPSTQVPMPVPLIFAHQLSALLPSSSPKSAACVS